MAATDSSAVQPTTELPAPATVDGIGVADTVLDEVVAGIRAAQIKHGFALAKEIGELVVDKLFGGDIDALRSRGSKELSLRQLSQRGDLPMSASALSNAIATYELLEREPGVLSSKHLTATHVRTVLPLTHRPQRRLLTKAEQEQWTVAQLAAEAAKAKKRSRKKSKGGRPPLPRFVKTINAMKKFADGGDDLFGDLDTVESLKAEDASELYRTVTELKLRCEDLQAKLRGQTSEFWPTE